VMTSSEVKPETPWLQTLFSAEAKSRPRKTEKDFPLILYSRRSLSCPPTKPREAFEGSGLDDMSKGWPLSASWYDSPERVRLLKVFVYGIQNVSYPMLEPCGLSPSQSQRRHNPRLRCIGDTYEPAYLDSPAGNLECFLVKEAIPLHQGFDGYS